MLPKSQQSHFVHLKFANRILTALGGGNHLPLFPAKRREQLHRGVGGGDPVHRLQARQQGRHSRSLRGTSGQFFSLSHWLLSYIFSSAGWLADRWVLLSSHVIGRSEGVENTLYLLRFGFHINALKSHWVLGFLLFMGGIQISYISYCMVLLFVKVKFSYCTFNGEYYVYRFILLKPFSVNCVKQSKKSYSWGPIRIK
jgi:hypothetical protein